MILWDNVRFDCLFIKIYLSCYTPVKPENTKYKENV